MLCVSFGSEETTYSGSLSGDVYKWKDRSLVQVIRGYHKVGSQLPVDATRTTTAAHAILSECAWLDLTLASTQFSYVLCIVDFSVM